MENGVLAFVEAVLIRISQLRIERRAGKTGADTSEGKNAAGGQLTFVALEGTVFSILVPARSNVIYFG